MSKICDICGKGPVFGGSVARRGMAKKKGGVGINITGRSKRVFYPNIQTVRVDEKDGVIPNGQRSCFQTGAIIGRWCRGGLW